MCVACSELHKSGALKLLLPLLNDAAELTASHCVLTLANVASYGGLCSDIVQLNAVHSLVALLSKAQSVETILFFRIFLLIASSGQCWGSYFFKVICYSYKLHVEKN